MVNNASADKKWHRIHTIKIRRREETHAERLIRRKQGLDLRLRKTFIVPKIFSLNNYDETAEFIKKIYNTVLVEDQNILLNFNECEVITPESCVVLAAEIDRCLRIKKRSVTGNYPNNPEVYATLEALGFFRLLGIKPSRGIFVDSDNFEVVRLVSGKGKKEQVTQGILGLFKSIPKFHQNQDLLGSRIFRALTEAMGNVIEHAYPTGVEQKANSLGRWWRAGFRESTTITIVLYDQGVGIPNTLPTTWPEVWSSLLSGRLPDDGMIIRLATELNRTSATQQGRGKGLPDIKKLIEYVGAGFLRIYSYGGSYAFSPEDGESTSTHKTPLQGTLIVWIVNAEGKTIK